MPNTLDFGTPARRRRLDERAAARRDPRRRARWPLGLREREDDARLPEARRRGRAAGAAAAGRSRIVELPRPPKGGAERRGRSNATAARRRRCAGHDLGLSREAGLPAVADPGAALVAAAHAAGIAVVALPGASSITLALAASGLNGQSFAFVGYLPVEAERARRAHPRARGASRRERQTQLMIETPYRNAALLGALLAQLQPATTLSVSVGLTLAGELDPQRPASRAGAPRPTPLAGRRAGGVLRSLAGR